jgi:DnaJ-class molecular chaperone
MKKINTMLSLTLGCCLALSVQARDQREYHEMVYESGCKSCHDQGVKNKPSDESCLTCHDIDDLAKQTTRKGDEIWQNPHNNLHYGKEVPCIECHGEHEPKQPLCKQCHTFEFPTFKYEHK